MPNCWCQSVCVIVINHNPAYILTLTLNFDLSTTKPHHFSDIQAYSKVWTLWDHLLPSYMLRATLTMKQTDPNRSKQPINALSAWVTSGRLWVAACRSRANTPVPWLAVLFTGVHTMYIDLRLWPMTLMTFHRKTQIYVLCCRRVCNFTKMQPTWRV